MKNVLLATTALLAGSIAGMAQAQDVLSGAVWSGSVEAGYTDGDHFTPNGGGFIDASFNFAFTRTTDSGITFGLGWGFDYDPSGYNNPVQVVDGNGDPVPGLFIPSDSVDFGGFPTFFAESSAGKVIIGDVDDFAAERNWNTINIADFFDALDGDFFDEDGEFALDVSGTYGGYTFGVSSIIGDGSGGPAQGTTSTSLGGLSYGMSGAWGGFSFAVAYEEESFDDGVFDAADPDNSTDDTYGIGAQTEFGGATIGLAYLQNKYGQVSTSIGGFYTFGNGFSLGAFYGWGEDGNDGFGVTAEYAQDNLALKLAYRDFEDSG